MDTESTLNRLDHLWSFTEHRVYMLVAIARSKENAAVAATDQPAIRKVVEDRDELPQKLEQIEHATSDASRLTDADSPTALEYRLYATINGRNARDALHFLQKEALDAIREGEKSAETPRILKRVDHEWKSILHQPRCRDEKRFLWDIDDTSTQARSSIRNSLEQHTSVLTTVETPNGFHIITEPFNFTAVDEFEPAENSFHGYECERKSDDMVFLGFLDS